MHKVRSWTYQAHLRRATVTGFDPSRVEVGVSGDGIALTGFVVDFVDTFPQIPKTQGILNKKPLERIPKGGQKKIPMPCSWRT